MRGRSYAPKGKTPEVYTLGGVRHKLSMIASVNNPGKAHWMMIETAFDAATFIEFLEGLIKDADHGGERKLHVIMNKLRVHHSKVVSRSGTWQQALTPLIMAATTTCKPQCLSCLQASFACA